METIVRIEEFDEPDAKSGWAGESGYLVETTEQVIMVSIQNHQDCCESWGYLWTNENIHEFIGATLLGINVVQEDTNWYDKTKGGTHSLDKKKFDGVGEGGVMFVDFDTDRGTLQFVAYNGHNGYYSHMARVESKQVTEEHSL